MRKNGKTKIIRFRYISRQNHRRIIQNKENQITKQRREKQIQCDKMTKRKLLAELVGEVTEEELDLHFLYGSDTQKNQSWCFIPAKPKQTVSDGLYRIRSADFNNFILDVKGDAAEGSDIQIVDLGMQGSKLVIVVEESFNSKDAVKRPKTPCAVLEIDHDHMPADILIVSTSGEEFKSISG